MRLHRTIFLSMAGWALLAPLASATTSYTVTIDTSSQLANYGYVDLQFDPSTLMGTSAATATVSNFMAVLNPADPNNSTMGDISGTLGPASSVMFDNGTSFNDYFEGLTFPMQITFELTLSSTPTNMGGGTTFAIDFLNQGQTQYLFTGDPDGNTATDYFVGLAVINPDGSVTTTSNPGPMGGPSLITFTPLMSSEVPEPSTTVLLAAGLIGLAGLARWKSASRQQRTF